MAVHFNETPGESEAPLLDCNKTYLHSISIFDVTCPNFESQSIGINVLNIFDLVQQNANNAHQTDKIQCRTFQNIF